MTVTTPVRALFAVAASRLASGEWGHDRERRAGEGDIHASYSSDLIAMKDRVRKPFKLRKAFYVAVGILHGPDGVEEATAYRLVPAGAFPSRCLTYGQRGAEGGHDAARELAEGFHHGLRVTRGGEAYVLSGPPVTLVPSIEPERVQAELF